MHIRLLGVVLTLNRVGDCLHGTSLGVERPDLKDQSILLHSVRRTMSGIYRSIIHTIKCNTIMYI